MNKKLQNQNNFRFVTRLFFLVLFVVLISRPVSAASMLQKNVTINVQNAPIKSVLEEIQKQTGYSFIYNQKELSTLPNITINAKNMSIESVLDTIFKNSSFSYKIVDKNISITKKQQKESAKKLSLKGKVIDSNTGKTIEGATIIVLGTTEGAITDNDGGFTLTIKAGSEIEISYVGMKPVKRTVTESNDKYLVEMRVDAMAVDEVVVTGYGDVKRSSFTGNSIVVKREDLLKVSKTNVIKALQTFDPSFRIKENNQWGSDPNALPEVYIRGESGIGSKVDLANIDNDMLSKPKLLGNPNLPTFIMDGFEISVSQLYDMDPNRIESITILKDAAATALYGSRAANGVVVITTVVPKPGKLNVSYSFVADVVAPDLSDYNLANAREKLDVENRAGFFNYKTENERVAMLNEYNEKLRNVERGVDTYWLSQPLKTVFNHKHSVYVDGGNEHLRFGIDLQYANGDGVMKGSGRDRFSAGFYLQYNYNNLSIRNYTSYNLTKSNESKFGNYADYSKQLPYNEIKDENDNYLKTLRFGRTPGKGLNPLYEATLGNYDKSDNDDLINNLSLNWNILKGLLLKGQLSITKSSSDSEHFIDPQSIRNRNLLGLANLSAGELSVGNGKTFSMDMMAYASYSTEIEKHNINLQAGINAKETNSTSVSSLYMGFPSGELHSINYAQELDTKPSSSENNRRMVGFLASLNYSYDNIYLLDASYRIDGSSEFGKDKRFAPFWSAGVGLNIHNYEFFKSIKAINQLKIRATYGQTGKVNFPAYAASTYYEVITEQWYKTGFGTKLKALGNDDLKWETTNTLDMGFELGMFSNRLYLNFSYYDKKTVDLINDVTIPSSTGFTTYRNNIGEVLNRGYEINVRGNIISKENMSLIVNANMAHNKNKMLKISESMKDYNTQAQTALRDAERYKDAYYTKPFMQYTEGSSLNSIWGIKSHGINPATGEEVFIRPDGTLTDRWSAQYQQVLGESSPKAQGSVGVNFTYKNFSIYTSFMYQFGGQTYNSTLADKVEGVDVYAANVDRRVLTERWIKPGDKAKYTGIKPDRSNYSQPRATSRFVQDYNVLSWSSLTVGYDFSGKLISKVGLGMLRVEIGANDLFHFSTVEQERGLSYPYARTFNFSLKASF